MSKFPNKETFIYYATERERIRVREEAGEPYPWTSDEILQRGSFCNVRREDDSTTRRFAAWYAPHRDDPGCWFLAAVARLASNEPTAICDAITFPLPWDKERFKAEMRAHYEAGNNVERAAYTIVAPNNFRELGYDYKFEWCADHVLDLLWTSREHVHPKPGEPLRAFGDRLWKAFSYVGKFYAAQVVADVKHWPLFSTAPDWWTYAEPGPGSGPGLRIAMGLNNPDSWKTGSSWHPAWYKNLKLFHDEIAPDVEKATGIRVDAQNAQNLLCEGRKLWRAQHGGEMPRRNYHPPGERKPAKPKKRKLKPRAAPTEAPVTAEPLPPAPHALPELAAARDANAPHVLHHDLETRSTVDLKAAGAWRYAVDPSTEVLCIGYAVDAEPVQLWAPGDPVPAEFIEAASNTNWTVVAHNDAFERLIARHILEPQHGFPAIPIERRRCSQAMALAAALPGKLEKAAEALSLPFAKDKVGAALMRRMAKPLAGDVWIEDPASLERLYDYCRRDVEVGRALYRAVPPLTAEEQAVWELDSIINLRGFHTDGALLEAASHVAAAAGQAVQDELARITDHELESTNQTDALQAWLAEHGCEVDNIRKGTLRHALRRKGLDPTVRRVIELRLVAAHASAKKVEALLRWRGDDGRVRGGLTFHGASTGRWSSLGIQVQNFKREAEDTEGKRAAVATGDLAHVAKCYPRPLEAVGDIARAMICAAPGRRLMIADFSGIESRVLAWVSGQESKLAQWRTFDATGALADDPYFLLGRACGLAEASARAIGKIADLAFGYMGGVGAWERLAPEDDASDEATIKRYQQAWRNAHPRIVQFWSGIDRAAITVVRAPGTVFRYGRFTLASDEKFLRITLPSGRSLSYAYPRLGTGKFGGPMVVFKDVDSETKTWGDCRHGQGAYGGTWTENVVQAIARDLLAEAMQRLDAAGYPVVLHVHDEAVAEVSLGFGDLDEFRRLVIALPDWAEGLPVAAKAREGERFSKPDASPRAFSAPSPQNDALGGGEHDESAQNSSTLSTPPGETSGDDPLADLLDGPEEAGDDYPEAGAAPNSDDDAGQDDDATGDDDDDDETEAPRGADQNQRGNTDRSHEQQRAGHGRDGYPHGERDSGDQVAFFVYRHADGRPYLGVKKTSTKQFPQFHWTGSGWAKGAPQGPKIPYRLPELIKAPLDAWVLICAGEKDADTAAALGFTATTNPEGERKGAWASELNAWFAGRKRVAVMEDNDATGRAHVLEVANALRGTVPDIRIVTFHDLPEHGDLTDWIERGHGRDDLLAKIESTQPYRPRPQPSPIRQWDGEPVPELEYSVPDRYPLDNVGLLSGEGGQGKSSLVEQLCVAHALGREWLGCTPRQGPAIYIECEDAERVLHWRLKTIAAHYKVTLTNIADAGFQMYPLADEENAVLATAPDKSGIVRPTPLYDWLYELAGDVKPVMIGIASSANVFAGNENVRTEVQQFIRLLRRIATVAHGTVLLVTQPSLTGIENKSASHEGLAGTTQWHNGVRARAVMKAVKPEDGIDTGLRAISFHKNQYGPASATCFVRYENGLFLPVEGMSIDAAARAAKAEEVFVDLLKRFTEQRQMVGPKPSSAYAPTRFAEHPEAKGITKKEFANAMQRLLDAKIIEIRTWGKPSRPSHYLALAGS